MAYGRSDEREEHFSILLPGGFIQPGLLGDEPCIWVVVAVLVQIGIQGWRWHALLPSQEMT